MGKSRICAFLDPEGIKTQWVLCAGSLLRGTISGCCYLVIAPGFNCFKDLGCLELCKRNPGRAVSGMCRELSKASVGSLGPLL